MYEFRPVSERMQHMRDLVRNRVIRLDAERTVIQTESFKENEHVIPMIKIPLATLAAAQKVTVRIEDFELLPGAKGKEFCGTGLTPMWGGIFWPIDLVDSGEWTLEDDGYYHNPAEEDGFALKILPEDVELLRECRPYWDEQGNYLSTVAEAWQPDGFAEMKALECTDYYEGMPLMICATGHLSAGFKKIIDVGYGAIKKQADDWMAAHKGFCMGEDMEKYIFYKSASIACEAGITFVTRYAEEAERKAAECTDPARKRELEMMADSLHHIATEPARNFWEACEATLLYQTLLYLDSGHSPSCSLGRFDQYTWPYLERDLAEGKITLDQAQEIVDCFFLKINAMYAPPFPAVAKHGGIGTTYNHTTLSGMDPETGEDATNEVTYMVIEAICRLKLHDPTTSVRMTKNAPDKLWDAALTASRIVGGLPLIQNDELIVPSLQEEMGFSLYDARNYCFIGCQEIVGSGCDYPAPCGVHPPHCSVWFGVVLSMAINNGINPMNGLQSDIHTGYLYDMKSFDEVLDAYEKLAHLYMRWEITMNNYTEYVTQKVSPHALLSISMDDCMEVGKDASQGGCRYNSYGGTAPGLATVSDSLCAIKYMCFDHDYCTTRELYDAVMANWEGYETLRQRIINEVPHYGNNDPYADDMHTWVVNVYLACCAEGYSTRSKKYKPGQYGASDHIAQGNRTWATPDGRKTGQPLADAASPAQGRDCCGPTAIFNSALTYDQSKIMDGMALNMRIHPSAVRSDEGLNKLRDMTKGYFAGGGMEVQYNIVDTETLLDAQKNPADHQDLVVRIAGYSAYFVELPEQLQDDIISRNEEMF